MKILSTEKLINPKYIKPLLLNYEYKGKQKQWEIVKTFDVVSALLYHKDKNALVIVKQFRPALLVSSDEKFGITYELCAGLKDKGKSSLETMKEEIEEEVGYSIPKEKISRLTQCFSGSTQTIYTAIIDDSMKISEGGGVDDEDIEVVYVPSEEVEQFIFDESKIKTTGLLFGFQYFLANYKNGIFNG